MTEKLGRAERRERALLAILLLAMLGVLVLGSLFGWYLHRESVIAEEKRLAELAQRLGTQAESALVDAREILDELNGQSYERCSDEHIQHMQELALQRPHVRAIGYWQAVERRCGTGFIQGEALTPPEASRIYPDGIVAWWPGASTEVGGVPLFLMRLGDHDLAIDTRLLLRDRLPDRYRAGLWVEGLLLAAEPENAELPEPGSLEPGLTMNTAEDEIQVRFQLESIFPMDLVAIQPSGDFWARYLPSLLTAAALGLVLMGLWFVFVYRLTRRQLSFTAELQDAIEHDGIIPVYQPIVRLSDGSCCGAEILARWQRDNGEAISPAVFVPIAERAELISALTQGLLRRAMKEMSALLREYPELTLNLNLSAQDLEDSALPDLLDQQLAGVGLESRSLKLEITERALLDHASCRRQISKLRERGYQIAIDDFGTGYSSLAYLESFELDTLKLDKAFVDAIETHAVTSSVIGHIIDMGRSLELSMVAEGIESPHQAQWLLGNGVEMGQGFHFSKPLSGTDFIRYFRGESA